MTRLTKSALVVVAVAFFASTLPAQEAETDKSQSVKSPAAKAAQRTKAPAGRQKRADTREARAASARDIRRRPAPTRNPEAMRQMMRQQQLKNLQTRIGQHNSEFQRYSGELNAIKKIAAQEGATKTVAYIDQLIKKKKSETDAKIKESQDKIKEIQAPANQKQAKERAERLEKLRQEKAVRTPGNDKSKVRKQK